jgi:hypothetical protein
MPIDDAVKRGCGEKEMPRLELGEGRVYRDRESRGDEKR